MTGKLLKACREENGEFVIEFHLDKERCQRQVQKVLDVEGKECFIPVSAPVPDPAWVLREVFDAGTHPDEAFQTVLEKAPGEYWKRLAEAGEDHRHPLEGLEIEF